MWRIALAVTAAACGRIDFDFASRSDASSDTAQQTYAATILADGPVGYWRLGEPSGTIAHDLSGHGNDGAFTGGVLLGQPGAVVNDANTSIALDGATGFVLV